ncbi:hypothetical protein QLY65_20160, partial [Cronobacter sakazakii]|nr:hypothetical protein [Cronobacter sakazakii]
FFLQEKAGEEVLVGSRGLECVKKGKKKNEGLLMPQGAGFLGCSWGGGGVRFPRPTCKKGGKM